MSEQAVLWLFGVLIAALFALIGTVTRFIMGKIAEIDTGALAAFKAMDAEREKQWMLWRIVVDKRLDKKRETLEEHEHRLTRLERNGHH